MREVSIGTAQRATADGQVRIERLDHVVGRTGTSRSQIYVGMREGWFPRSVRIGPGAVGWVSTEIDQWIAAKVAERDAAAAR